MNESKYYIIYPRGERDRLSVVEICHSLSYELSDYSVASRRDFISEVEAITYAAELAKKHGLVFERPRTAEGDYLD